MLISYFKKLGETGARGSSSDVAFSSLFASEEKAREYVERYKEAVLELGDEVLGEQFLCLVLQIVMVQLKEQFRRYQSAFYQRQDMFRLFSVLYLSANLADQSALSAEVPAMFLALDLRNAQPQFLRDNTISQALISVCGERVLHFVQCEQMFR